MPHELGIARRTNPASVAFCEHALIFERIKMKEEHDKQARKAKQRRPHR